MVSISNSFMKTYKILPTSKLVDKIYNDNYISAKPKGEMYKHDVSGRCCKGKLTSHQVDLIRYLLYCGFNALTLSTYFNTVRSVIPDIKKLKKFYDHTSPFQISIGKYRKDIDIAKLEDWKQEHSAEIDVFMKWYYDEYLINFDSGMYASKHYKLKTIK